ncbi:MAG: glycogen debranching protein GlgX [Planctomycetota bacterium]
MGSLNHARGRCLPLGASKSPRGVNFVLLTRHGTRVWLVISDVSGELIGEFPLHPRGNRTGDHWHIEVIGLPDTFTYGWRVDGPRDGRHRFDGNRILFDPACTAIAGGHPWGAVPLDRRSLFVRRPFDWQGDVPPCLPLEDSLVYELHVRGFTVHPSSMVAHPGTFMGLVEKIPHLKSLGVTAVELLPVHEFDENDCPFRDPDTGAPLRNFWGYNTIGFAAVKAAYASTGGTNGQIAEFREMVRAFHQAGIEVILDVVFNHTGEGNALGRTTSFRGIDNEIFYLLDSAGNYLNFSGCGNTVNCNHPLVRDLILTCLRYWVADMHVDGLRFDLASILGRDRLGRVLVDPPVVETISEDGVLADTKLIAEPWDAAGLYQVGLFPYGGRWSEWNGQYRDIVRRFWKGDAGMAGPLATRMCGSADLYESAGRKPMHSVNFITCHDGFTLADLVSFERKHNRANGEDNRDGCNHSHSFNCGHEGPTDDPAVIALRARMARNLMGTLFLSQGVPMILAGDEFLRTQQGNNNAWCQDNEISWVDWSLADLHDDFLRFTRLISGLRKRVPALRRREFLEEGDVVWHGRLPGQPDFSPESQLLAFALDGARTGRESGPDLFVLVWAGMQPITAVIPPSPTGRLWRRVVDTGLPSPEDIVDFGTGPHVDAGAQYRIWDRSLVVLATD